MRLRSRLMLSHGIIIAIMCLVMPLALFAIRNLAVQVNNLAAADLLSNQAIERISHALDVEITSLLEMTLIAPSSADVIVDPATPTHANRAASAHAVSAAKTRLAIASARSQFQNETERTALETFAMRYLHFENAIRIWQARGLTQTSSQELSSDFDQMGLALSELREIKNAQLHKATLQARNFASDMIGLIGALAGLALLIGLFATVRLVNSVSTLTSQLTDLGQRLSSGNFDIAYVHGSIDEFNALGQHFELLGESLRLFHATNLQQLIVEQRRGEAVLDSIDDGLVIFSHNGRIERINPVAERQLGIEYVDANGKRFEEIGDATIGAHVRELLQTGEFVHIGEAVIQIQHAEQTRTIAYWLHHFVESASARAGVVLVLRDVTEQREFDQLRSEFVLHASHELRTPITSISMGLGLLQEKLKFAPGSRDEQLFQTVQTELARMIALLGDLLDLSRLREGQQVMERVPTAIALLLEQALARFKLAAIDAGIHLELEVEADLPRLALAQNAMARVLDNLIGNAMRYTPGGGRIMLSAHRATHHLAIGVTDSGVGIPASRLVSIFEPFVQVGKKRGGAGLGLAICKEIVQQHGGTIQVSSVQNRGTTFTVLLPI